MKIDMPVTLTAADANKRTISGRIVTWGEQGNTSAGPTVFGADSIKFGIDIMKGYTLYVTKRSVNLKKELKKYIWLKDKSGKSLDVPIDAFNHAIDASRY